ncbi:MAG: ABC transporter permease [Thermoleophilia bacterium]|nr:ABC transporter permease [Thermoleophilia bacterium]MDH3724120.1 ABC transporter permease [Thermoleophilia bacterium]
MGSRWRKVRSDLVFNKSRSILAIASLAVGMLAVGAMYLAGATIGTSFESSFLGANPPSAMLRTEPFSSELVDDVAAHPTVSEVEGRRILETRVTNAKGDSVNVELVAMNDFAENRVAKIEPATGTWPPTNDAIVVERSSVDELGAGVGDTVSINLPGKTPVDLPVNGTAFDVYEVTPTLGGPARAYLSMATMAKLTGSRLLNSLYIRASDDPLDRNQAIGMTTAVRDGVLEPANVAIESSAIQEPSEHRANNAIASVVSIMRLLSLLALVIAVALVINTVSALLAQQRRQVGVMKAIGGTSGQLTTQYLAYVLLLSLGALIVAIPLSVLTGRFLAGFIADLANFDLEPLGIPWATIVIEIVIATLLPIAAVILSVRRASRVTVQEAISDRGITTPARRGRAVLPFARPTVLAYRNAVRNRSRLVLTVLTIAVSGAVLVGVLSTGQALSRLGDDVAGYWSYDVELALTETTELKTAAAVLEKDQAVEGVEGWFEKQAFRIRPDGTENENVSLIAAPTGSPSIDPTLIEGRWFEAADDHPIVVNSHFADEESDVGVGDQVVLDIEGARREWRIVGVSTTTLVGPVVYVPTEDLAAELGEVGQTNFLAVRLAPGADQAAVADRIEATARDAGIPVGVVQTNSDRRDLVNNLFVLVVVLLLAVGAILAIVAAIGVAGTMTLGVIEQTREVGVIRTLGASGWAVTRLLLLQGLAIAAAGCVLGIALSFVVDFLLREVIGSSLLAASLPASLSWVGIAVWIPIALVIGALGATRPARVAAKLTIRDTLAYE